MDGHHRAVEMEGGKRAMTMRDVEGTGELVIVSPTYLLCLLFLFLCLSAVEEIHPPPNRRRLSIRR